MLGVTALAVALSLLTLFSFKNRPNQIRLAWVMMAVTVVLIGLAVWQIQTISAVVPLKTSIMGFISSALAIIFGFLAIRYIRKDELLVRSADRLR